ncbi:hypothetical protein RSAG8_11446, partial [Rhizoctonia solani AG-8 WAC10335]
MGAISMWLVILIHHCSFPDNIPTPKQNVWDCFPFNNPTFCMRFSLCDTTVSLSLPPEGPVGDQIKEQDREEWESHIPAPSGETEVEGEVKGEGQEEEGCDAEWKKYVLALDYKDWNWLLSQSFSHQGGLYDQLQQLMQQFHCDPETMHKIQRHKVRAKCKKEGLDFQELMVDMATAFQDYWSDAWKGISLAIFGTSIIMYGTVDELMIQVVKAMCNHLFKNDMCSLIHTVKKLKEMENDLIKAYKAAESNFNANNFRYMYQLLSQVLWVQAIIRLDINTDEGSF